MKRFQFSLFSALAAICFAGALAATIIGWKPAWQAEREIKCVEGDDMLVGLVPSPDGHLLLSLENRRTSVHPPRIWNVESGTLATELPKVDLGDVRFSPDGRKIFDNSYSGGKIWDTATGKVSGSFMAHGGRFSEAGRLSPDCSLVVSYVLDEPKFAETIKPGAAGGAGKPKPLLPTGLGTLPIATPSLGGPAMAPDMEEAPQAPQTAVLTVWDTINGKEVVKKEFKAKREPSLSWSGDGKRLILIWPKKITVLDSMSMRELGVINIDHRLEQYVLSENGKYLVAQGQEDAIEVWDLDAFKLAGTLEPITPGTRISGIAPDGHVVLTASEDNTQLWDTTTCKSRGVLSLPLGPSGTVLFSRDSLKLAIATPMGSVRIYNANTGEHLGGFNFQMFTGMHSLNFMAGDRFSLISGKSIYIYRNMPGQWWRQFGRLETWMALIFGVLFFSRVWAFLSSLGGR